MKKGAETANYVVKQSITEVFYLLFNVHMKSPSLMMATCILILRQIVQAFKCAALMRHFIFN